MTDEGYQFNDDTAALDAQTPVRSHSGSSSTGSNGAARGARGDFAQEIASKTIQAKFRTFYVDLKKSANGYFVKISEKSHGRKSTIMMDMEDVSPILAALQEVSSQAK
jgi:PurA ssDNA and RNA-binding protein